MNKKAQGLSLNTIIIAIVVLIVLVVLIMIFTGYFGARFAPEVAKCENAGGQCQFPNTADGSTGCGFNAFGVEIETLSANCPNTEQVCCSKGLGSGQKAEDNSDCGESGKEPCSGNQCNPALSLAVDGKCRPTCASLGGIGGNCRSTPCDASKNEQLSGTKASCSSSTSFCCVAKT